MVIFNEVIKESKILTLLKDGYSLYFAVRVFQEFKDGALNYTKYQTTRGRRGLVYVPSQSTTLTPQKNLRGEIEHRSHALALTGVVKISKDYPKLYNLFGGGYFILKNSWGNDTGKDGMVFLPFNYCKIKSENCSVVQLGNDVYIEHRGPPFWPRKTLPDLKFSR